jgi:orotate phosphoribosyltransferase-like protein
MDAERFFSHPTKIDDAISSGATVSELITVLNRNASLGE